MNCLFKASTICQRTFPKTNTHHNCISYWMSCWDGLYLPCQRHTCTDSFFRHTQTGLRGSRLPSSIHPAWPTPRLTPDSGQDTPASTQPPTPLKWTCGGLFLQRLGLPCPNFPLYTQIICAWVMQTEGSSKCMWTPLMAPASWSWNGTLGSGTAAVKISAVAIRQRDYTGLRGLFHNSRVITTGVIHTYDEYIIPFCWIWSEQPLLIHNINV